MFFLGCQKGLLEEVRLAEEGSTPREALPKGLESSEAKAGARDSGKRTPSEFRAVAGRNQQSPGLPSLFYEEAEG